MLRKIPFTDTEHRIVDEIPGFFGGPGTPVRDYPVSPRENIASLMFEREPYWLPTFSEMGMFWPDLYNDLLGRGGPAGTTDAFGIDWVWVEMVGGSIVKPGNPLMTDANEWKDLIKIPDIDAWDWAGAAEKAKIDKASSAQMSLVNGFWFERLISFMDFENAAVALIDPDQKEAVKELFEALTDLACKVVDKFCEFWPALDGIQTHDDWGSQRNAFFSEEIARELFLPYMKTFTDHVHSKGRYCTLHSCGHVENRAHIFVEAGFDQWDPQDMNDTAALYDAYGDKMVISVIPEPFDPETTPEAEIRERARAFVDRFVQKGKPCMIGFYGSPALASPVFAEELYEASRKKYLSL